MPPPPRYPYQTSIMVTADMSDWIDHVSDEDGISKAHVIRLAFTEGRKIITNAQDPNAILTDPPSTTTTKGVTRYERMAVPVLSLADGSWADQAAQAYDISKGSLIRTALDLGRQVVERRRRAARKAA